MTTKDTVGKLVLEQPTDGYRVNADAVLLEAFARPARGVAFDLGAGAGTIGLLLALRGTFQRVVLVERDALYADLARANAMRNGLSDRVVVVHADVTAAARAHRGTASLIVCNPPYVRAGAGRAPKASRAAARMGDPLPFIRAARELLGRRGAACFIYPASDFVGFSSELRRSGLEPKRARFVHASKGSPARVVMIEAKAGKPGGLQVEPPLFDKSWLPAMPP